MGGGHEPPHDVAFRGAALIYALDTNVLVALQKLEPAAIAQYQSALEQGHILAVPAVVRYEARRELVNPLYQRRLERLDALLSGHRTLDFDEAAADLAVEIFEKLRAAGRLIDHPDILITATCLRHTATLVTRNTGHFQRISNLHLADWL